VQKSTVFVRFGPETADGFGEEKLPVLVQCSDCGVVLWLAGGPVSYHLPNSK